MADVIITESGVTAIAQTVEGNIIAQGNDITNIMQSEDTTLIVQEAGDIIIEDSQEIMIVEVQDNVTIVEMEPGVPGADGEPGEPGTTDYNELDNLPDLSVFLENGDNISELNNDVGYITDDDLPGIPTLQEVTDKGNATTNNIIVPDEAYGAGWNGSMSVPTKNSLYSKIENLMSYDGEYAPGTMTKIGQMRKIGMVAQNVAGISHSTSLIISPKENPAEDELIVSSMTPYYTTREILTNATVLTNTILVGATGVVDGTTGALTFTMANVNNTFAIRNTALSFSSLGLGRSYANVGNFFPAIVGTPVLGDSYTINYLMGCHNVFIGTPTWTAGTGWGFPGTSSSWWGEKGEMTFTYNGSSWTVSRTAVMHVRGGSGAGRQLSQDISSSISTNSSLYTGVGFSLKSINYSSDSVVLFPKGWQRIGVLTSLTFTATGGLSASGAVVGKNPFFYCGLKAKTGSYSVTMTSQKDYFYVDRVGIAGVGGTAYPIFNYF